MKARFHDLRHTACTRMLEAGTQFPIVSSIMVWSPGTTVMMAKRYGHIGQEAFKKAVASLDDQKRRRANGKKISRKR